MSVHVARMPSAVDDEEQRERVVPNRAEWRWGTVVRWGVVATLVAVAIATYAWQSESKHESSDVAGEVPLLKADEQPVKVRPESPGGLEIADRDKFIYRRLREGGTGQTIERLLPAPEEPKRPPALLPTHAPTGAPDSTDGATSNAGFQASPYPDPDVVRPTATPEAIPDKRIASAVPSKPAAAQATATPAPAAPGGAFVVQIGAVRTQQEVQAEWNRLRRSHGDLLGGLALSVARADLGEKGVFYRLRAGPVDGEDRAKRLCSSLTQRKVNCYPVRAGG